MNQDGAKLDKDTAEWYVLNTYSAYENKVKQKIEMIIENEQENIYDVQVPTEEVIEKKDGKEIIKEKKLFPGYVLIKMNVTPRSWHMIRNINGVSGFVGPDNDPVPLSEEEVRNFGVKTSNKIGDIDVEVGDHIKIINGLFKDMPAEIIEIDYEKGSIKGIVSMFGRDTSVELGYEDIQKMD